MNSFRTIDQVRNDISRLYQLIGDQNEQDLKFLEDLGMKYCLSGNFLPLTGSSSGNGKINLLIPNSTYNDFIEGQYVFIPRIVAYPYQISFPPTPSISPTGTGTITYSYSIAAVSFDSRLIDNVEVSMMSGYCVGGIGSVINTTLSSSNYNTISFTVPNSLPSYHSLYLIYRHVSIAGSTKSGWIYAIKPVAGSSYSILDGDGVSVNGRHYDTTVKNIIYGEPTSNSVVEGEFIGKVIRSDGISIFISLSTNRFDGSSHVTVPVSSILDGVTIYHDNTVPLKTALNELSTNAKPSFLGGNGSIYLVRDSLQIGSSSSLLLGGSIRTIPTIYPSDFCFINLSGSKNVKISNYGNSANPISTVSYSFDCRNILTTDFDQISNNGSIGLMIESTNSSVSENIIFDGISIGNVSSPLAIVGYSEQVKKVIFRNCQFFNSSSNVMLLNSLSISFENCDFESIGYDKSLVINNSIKTKIRNCSFIANSSSLTHISSFSVGSSDSELSIDGNYFVSGSVGVKLSPTVKRIQITNNDFTNIIDSAIFFSSDYSDYFSEVIVNNNVSTGIISTITPNLMIRMDVGTGLISPYYDRVAISNNVANSATTGDYEKIRYLFNDKFVKEGVGCLCFNNIKKELIVDSSNSIYNKPFDIVGLISSGISWSNPTPWSLFISINDGTFSSIAVGRSGDEIELFSSSPCSFFVNVGESLKLTFTNPPTRIYASPINP